jgi:hypothetical protein
LGLLSRLFGARSKQELEGLELPNPAWKLTGLTEPALAFQGLRHLVAPGRFLFLEGGQQPGELGEFLAEHRVALKSRPALGTIWPAASYVAVPLTQAVLEGLMRLTEGLPYSQVCWHMHVFSEDAVLVSGHDAFSDPFYVSGDVPEERLQEICKAAGCGYSSAHVVSSGHEAGEQGDEADER